MGTGPLVLILMQSRVMPKENTMPNMSMTVESSSHRKRIYKTVPLANTKAYVSARLDTVVGAKALKHGNPFAAAFHQAIHG